MVFARTSSLCGTQSRTSATTSAPAETNLAVSQLPSKPVAPVTNVGRSCQNVVISPTLSMALDPSPTNFPNAARRAACPYIAKILHDDRRQVVVPQLIAPSARPPTTSNHRQ